MSNFSFSHSVFNSLELQTRKNQDLFGKGLISHLQMPSICLQFGQTDCLYFDAELKE